MVYFGAQLLILKFKGLILVQNLFKWQRAMTVRKVLQEILEKNPRFHHLTPLKTKNIAHWCRCHGYTPPDPESLRHDGDSIEDVLTRIDSEPGRPWAVPGLSVLASFQPYSSLGIRLFP